MFDIIINPFTTALMVLYHLFGGSIFFAIVGFTVIVRMAILPMTMRQQKSMKRMQEVQPKLKALQEKYKGKSDPDARQKLAQEQMALYKEEGINPLAPCLPLLIQLPIFIGLWRAIIAALASTPEALVTLEHRILFRGFWESAFSLNIDSLVPLENQFLWLNLALPDPYYILPILVVITSFLQQRLIMPQSKPDPNADKDDPSQQAAQMTRQMTTFMPLFIGFLALSYASGLSIYFITSNIIGIIQYTAMGRADFGRLIGRESSAEEDADAEEAVGSGAMVEATAGADGSSGPQLKEGITVTTLSAKAKKKKSRKSNNKNRSNRGRSSRRKR